MGQQTDLIVSVSGIRGIVGAGLTPEAATAFAAALGTSTNGGKIIVSRDGRPSGEMLRHAVIAGLLSAGCEVHDLGVLPTPTCGLAIRRLHAAGGIQITASHNPAPWNGLKLFGSDGAVLPSAQGEQIKQIFLSQHFRRASWNQLGKVIEARGAGHWHQERVLGLVDVQAIHSAQLRTFLDANGGAGGPLGRSLLEAFRTAPVCNACDADGFFAHEPEPIAENLREICACVAQHRADIGFVLDPDADRLALIDETGRYIGEELTLALALLYRLRQ
jgi:phosphomannomutase